MCPTQPKLAVAFGWLCRAGLWWFSFPHYTQQWGSLSALPSFLSLFYPSGRKVSEYFSWTWLFLFPQLVCGQSGRKFMFHSLQSFLLHFAFNSLVYGCSFHPGVLGGAAPYSNCVCQRLFSQAGPAGSACLPSSSISSGLRKQLCTTLWETWTFQTCLLKAEMLILRMW